MLYPVQCSAVQCNAMQCSAVTQQWWLSSTLLTTLLSTTPLHFTKVNPFTMQPYSYKQHCIERNWNTIHYSEHCNSPFFFTDIEGSAIWIFDVYIFFLFLFFLNYFVNYFCGSGFHQDTVIVVLNLQNIYCNRLNQENYLIIFFCFREIFQPAKASRLPMLYNI